MRRSPFIEDQNADEISRRVVLAEFQRKHPFVLADGRRFSTLYCAARSAVDDKSLMPVKDELSGISYDFESCLRAAHGPNPAAKTSPVW